MYSIVIKHGGHVNVRSEMGGGTTFSILLPASGKQVPESIGVAVPLIPKGCGGKSVLVMDDEEVIRELASEMFRELGYVVSTCTNGAEAVARYNSALQATTPFWAVVLDLTIPGGMGGKEAAREVLGIDGNARLIVSSGYSNDPVMADYSHHGFRAAVVKPYTFTELSRVMTELQQ